MSAKKKGPKKIAALCRVSGEKQRDLGESLKIQAEQIRSAAASLGLDPKADIVWDFSGQEHTFHQSKQRKLLNALLDEVKSGKCRFDSVMVASQDRLGRDSATNKEIHRTLQDHGIDFYNLGHLYDYEDPNDQFVLGINAEVSEFVAWISTKKSLLTRTERALQGKYTAGRLLGRTWDKENGRYIVDQAISEKLTRACKALDAGEGSRQVAEKIGMSTVWLHQCLKKAGSEITFSIGSQSKMQKTFPKDRQFTIQVPPLVEDAELLTRVIARINQNRSKFRAGNGKSDLDFLLKGMVRCGVCGYMMLPEIVKYKAVPEEQLKRKRKKLKDPDHPNATLYYRHNMTDSLKGSCIHERLPKDIFPYFIPTKKLDGAVLRSLMERIYDKSYWESALKEAEKRNGKESAKLREEIAALEQDLAATEKGKTKLINLVVSQDLDDADVAKKIKELSKKAESIAAKIAAKREEILSAPSKERIEGLQRRVNAAGIDELRAQMDHSRRRVFEKALKLEDAKERTEKLLQILTLSEQRAILARFLGQPGNGVFVQKKNGKGGAKYRIEVRSDLPAIELEL